MDKLNFAALDAAVTRQNSDDVQTAYKSMVNDSADLTDIIKSRLEVQLRTNALRLGRQNAEGSTIKSFLDFVVRLAAAELCLKPLTVTVLQDILESSTKTRCEELSPVVEEMISTWKTPFFADACRNGILRLCNDLLKRLSRTVDTGFCGRILILLAKSLPLTERSGLNLMSHTNVGNVTLYDENTETKDEKTTTENGELEQGEISDTKEPTIDYDLYVKFWGLQAFFVDPSLAYNAEKWLVFKSNLSDVLDVFSAYKIEKLSSHKPTSSDAFEEIGDSTPTAGTIESTINADEMSSFSAKYLTNQKLFNLQLADPQFRRYFLTQAITLASYLLNTEIRSRDASHTLSTTQVKSVKDLTKKCYQLLAETHARGMIYSNNVKTVISNDKLWSDWKNTNCPDYVGELKSEKLIGFKRKPISSYDALAVDLSNAELTRLWNVNPQNLEACKAEARAFKSEAKSCVDDIKDLLDPTQQVEEEYLAPRREKFDWILTRHALYFGHDEPTTAEIGNSALDEIGTEERKATPPPAKAPPPSPKASPPTKQSTPPQPAKATSSSKTVSPATKSTPPTYKTPASSVKSPSTTAKTSASAKTTTTSKSASSSRSSSSAKVPSTVKLTPTVASTPPNATNSAPTSTTSNATPPAVRNDRKRTRKEPTRREVENSSNSRRESDRDEKKRDGASGGGGDREEKRRDGEREDRKRDADRDGRKRDMERDDRKRRRSEPKARV